MNERLKDLLPNPYMVDYQVPHDGCGFDLYDEKKMIEYGQMIVRECIAKCNDLESMKYIADHFDIRIQGLNNE
jgi:hypothetical protein